MFDKITALFSSRIAHASFAFLGFGVLQTWMFLMAAQTRSVADVAYGYTQLLLDLGSFPTFLILMVFARRFVPLFDKRAPEAVGLVVMMVGNALIALASFVPGCPRMLSLVGLAVSGCGSALMVLCWWEIYGVLNSVEVALYYAGSLLLREVLIFVLAGYSTPYLIGASFLLPWIAASMLDAGRDRVLTQGLTPKIVYGSTSFPWKPMLLVGLYSFAYGCGTWLVSYSDDLYMHLGMLVPVLLVCASVLLPHGRFDFTAVYRFILPVAMAGLLVLLLASYIGTSIATVFILVSNTSVFIYVSILLCNLSRRYHISAVWLFALFNITHIAFLGMGTIMSYALPPLIILGVCIVCIVFVTFIIISEPTLTSDWHIVLTSKGDSLAEHDRQQIAIARIALEYGLSAREHEILTLLYEGNMPRYIGRELNIAPGTVKAHIQHIYRKTGVHSKEELDDLVSP